MTISTFPQSETCGKACSDWEKSNMNDCPKRNLHPIFLIILFNKVKGFFRLRKVNIGSSWTRQWNIAFHERPETSRTAQRLLVKILCSIELAFICCHVTNSILRQPQRVNRAYCASEILLKSISVEVSVEWNAYVCDVIKIGNYIYCPESFTNYWYSSLRHYALSNAHNKHFPTSLILCSSSTTRSLNSRGNITGHFFNSEIRHWSKAAPSYAGVGLLCCFRPQSTLSESLLLPAMLEGMQVNCFCCNAKYEIN
jgi:hypothetical protein